MKEMEEYLPKERFLRVQKSFIVHTSRVKAVEGHQIILDNEEILPLGAIYRAAFLEKINARLWKSRRLPDPIFSLQFTCTGLIHLTITPVR